MDRRRRERAALLLAAACFFCLLLPSRGTRAGDDDEVHLILFSGRDFWRNGTFGYGGLLYAPGGFDESGFTLRLIMSDGRYGYPAGDLNGDEVVGKQWLAGAMPGFFVKRGSFEGKFYFGPEWQQHWLEPDDPGNSLRGQHIGLRFGTELWYEPTAATMTAADASLTSIGSNFSARLAYGWHISAFVQTIDFYVGPETQIYGADSYRQWRVGAHITSMKTGATEWSAAGGWAIDTDRRSSAYVRLSLMQKVAD